MLCFMVNLEGIVLIFCANQEWLDSGNWLLMVTRKIAFKLYQILLSMHQRDRFIQNGC